MSVEKVILLHGPVDSPGTSPIAQNLYFSDREMRAEKNWNHMFVCDENIRALSYVFRQYGFKIAYSGWNEDRAWLEEHRDLFDYLVISDQSTLRAYSTYKGEMIGNRKEKLYFSCLQGLKTIRDELGDDALVFRLRSDIAVDPRAVIDDMVRLLNRPGLLIGEYFDTRRPFSAPDFMLLGHANTLTAIYDHLYTISAADKSYHLSSHVDHTFTYLQLMKNGTVSSIELMKKRVFDSVVWRGIPRYLSYVFPNYSEELYFGGGMVMDKDADIDAMLALLEPPEMHTNNAPG